MWKREGVIQAFSLNPPPQTGTPDFWHPRLSRLLSVERKTEKRSKSREKWLRNYFGHLFAQCQVSPKINCGPRWFFFVLKTDCDIQKLTWNNYRRPKNNRSRWFFFLEKVWPPGANNAKKYFSRLSNIAPKKTTFISGTIIARASPKTNTFFIIRYVHKFYILIWSLFLHLLAAQPNIGGGGLSPRLVA